MLGGVAGLLAGGTAIPGVAAADSDEPLPVHATGTRTYTFRPDGDRFVVEERFTSPDLVPRYGRATVEFETTAVPREALPSRYRTSAEPFALQTPDSAVIGTFAEHWQAEQKLRGHAEEVSATASYTGPLYVYNSDADDPDVGDLGERTGPINVGWNESLWMDASDIDSHMHSNGWQSPWLGTAGTRYIILHYEGTTYLYTKAQDEHIGKNYGASWTPDQWHIRAYDLPDHSTAELAVVGQVHRDPQDHGIIGDDPDWHFTDSRQEVTGDWSGWDYSRSIEYVGNGGQFDSSYGYLGRVDP